MSYHNKVPVSMSRIQERLKDAGTKQHNVASQLMRRWELTADTNGSSSRAQLFFQVEDRAKNTLEQDKGVLRTCRRARRGRMPSDLIKWRSDLVDHFVKQPLEELSKAVN